MKRLRSSDDLDEKNTSKDSATPNPNRSSSSSSHRSFYYKSDNVRKGLVSPSSSSRYDRDRSLDEDSRMVRKRSDHDFDSFDSRKGGFDRYNNRDGGGPAIDRAIHRSESFCGPILSQLLLLLLGLNLSGGRRAKRTNFGCYPFRKKLIIILLFTFMLSSLQKRSIFL